MAINQTYAGPDEDRAILMNYDFRLAVATAINRERVNEVITLGEGNPNRYFLPPPGHAYHPGDEYETLPYTYDPDEANRILLPASRRCHTAPARNAALCPALLPLTGTRPRRGSAATRTAGAVGQRDCRRRRSSARLAPAPHLAP